MWCRAGQSDAEVGLAGSWWADQQYGVAAAPVVETWRAIFPCGRRLGLIHDELADLDTLCRDCGRSRHRASRAAMPALTYASAQI
jgi:hypothetical protein